jgi:hypothetical protein
MDVRYAAHGRLKVHLGLLAALASRQVTFQALRKGMRMGTVLSRPETFLRAHHESGERLGSMAEILAEKRPRPAAQAV